MSGVYIRIPKEFEAHFDYDRFVDSLTRLMVDAHCLAGNYEKETAAMLIEVFKKAIPVPDHGRLIDADALLGDLSVEYPSVVYAIETAPTIIPAEEEETT